MTRRRPFDGRFQVIARYFDVERLPQKAGRFRIGAADPYRRGSEILHVSDHAPAGL